MSIAWESEEWYILRGSRGFPDERVISSRQQGIKGGDHDKLTTNELTTKRVSSEYCRDLWGSQLNLYRDTTKILQFQPQSP